jgi:hypothetical protein
MNMRHISGVVVRSSLALLLSALLLGCAARAPKTDGPLLIAVAANECNAAPDLDRTQYVVGYGSLMQQESRRRTSPDAGPAHPIELHGYKRGWFSRGRAVGLSTTYLGVIPERSSRLNAVMYQVDEREVLATDARELSYCRTAVPSSQISTLESDYVAVPDAQIWIYVSREEFVGVPSARYPIVQSYVDIFLSGCLEQEQQFGLSGYSEECIATTSNWSEHWVNDRIFPRRAFVFQPRASQIDTLLAAHLTKYFERIRIEPQS